MSIILAMRLPRGCATISMPVSEGLSGSVISMWAWPPGNSSEKISEKFSFTRSKTARKRVRILRSMAAVIFFRDARAASRSATCSPM